MTKLPRCYLSVRDFHVLEQLTKDDIVESVFYRLIRQKVTGATIIAHELLDPQVATIGNRVDFVIDGGRCAGRVIRADEGELPSGLRLPVTTMRGLALLGLKSGEVISIELPDGATERLRLEKVDQPRVTRRGLTAVTGFRRFSSGDEFSGPRG
jgi:regulator of nucleoside diphosphate kinase